MMRVAQTCDPLVSLYSKLLTYTVVGSSECYTPHPALFEMHFQYCHTRT